MEFLHELYEARMLRNPDTGKRLTYADCSERSYLILLSLELLSNFNEFKSITKQYAKQSNQSFDRFLINGTDLHNFVYFIIGPDQAQSKLKNSKKAIEFKHKLKFDQLQLSNYLKSLESNQSFLRSKFFMDLESKWSISANYKDIRRAILNLDELPTSKRKYYFTKLLFALRAKLRNSDIIDDIEKWAVKYAIESDRVPDNEPIIHSSNINTNSSNYYRFLVGEDNLLLTKAFLTRARSHNAVSADMLHAYSPIVEMIDDIVNAGPNFIHNLKLLHKRAQKK